ncbi:tetratricopeptide repeat protein [Roseibacillus ishigakijimensis]|uniref:Tetratricopeptide repeat protein n=1 Tax=Roseibacillus ishigakijimensis TaxID=454146 RepID=A0A934RT13_9BACT|nr:tetratricopeptide repeat protein [Roseibacillus ishigakijimensis]MBK1833976.1 tetratricopeptide repeat protein [Roseibacillus ishigakijimensis]
MRTILLAALLAGPLAADPLRVPKEQFRSPEFLKGFVGAYGFLSPVEPKVDREENELLADLAGLFSDARFREAEARIVDFIKKRKNPVEEGVAPKEVSPALIFQLAQLYFMNDRTEDAERAYKLAIKGHPDFRRAHKYLALLYAGQDRVAEALPHLKKAIQLGEADQLVYGLLGYAYTQDNKPLAAEAAYRQAYLLNPDETQWSSGLTLSLYQQEKWPEAAAMLGDLLAVNPEASDFWKMQANCYLNMEQPLRAAENFEVMRLKDLADESTLNTLGDIYTDQKKPVLALGAYLAALAKSESLDVERSLRTANILADYGAPREAAKYITAVREKKGGQLTRSQQISFYLTEVKIAKSEGDPLQVGRLVQQILELDPSNGEALVENGIYHEQLAENAADEEEAIRLIGLARAQFKLAMNSADEQTQYLANRSFGQMLVRQREFVEAMPYIERALALKPSDGLSRFAKQVSIFAERQKETRAREEAEQAALRAEQEKKREAEANDDED